VRKFGEKVQLQLLQLTSWLWFGLSLGYGLDFILGFWLFFLGALSLEKGASSLVGYWSATRIILSVKVKVLGGGLCAYVWVTILLYCLWKKEHIPLFLIGYGPTLSSDSLTIGRLIGKLFVKLIMAPIIAAARFFYYAAAKNPNPYVQALLVKHLT
jgi:hypothetical protein